MRPPSTHQHTGAVNQDSRQRLHAPMALSDDSNSLTAVRWDRTSSIDLYQHAHVIDVLSVLRPIDDGNKQHRP